MDVRNHKICIIKLLELDLYFHADVINIRTYCLFHEEDGKYFHNTKNGDCNINSDKSKDFAFSFIKEIDVYFDYFVATYNFLVVKSKLGQSLNIEV